MCFLFFGHTFIQPTDVLVSVVSCVLTLLFVVETQLKPTSNPPHIHTPTDPGVVHRWDDNKHGKGVNISKCWLHKSAASKNSCREQRASGWPADEGGVVAVFFSGLSHCGLAFYRAVKRG